MPFKQVADESAAAYAGKTATTRQRAQLTAIADGRLTWADVGARSRLRFGA